MDWMNRTTVDLDKVEVGQRVAWVSYGAYGNKRIPVTGEVSRLTNTQIVVTVDRGGSRSYEARFYRKNGCMIGERVYLANINDGHIVNYRTRERAIKILRDVGELATRREINDAAAALDVIREAREDLEKAEAAIAKIVEDMDRAAKS